MTGIELLRQLLAANPDSLHQEVVIMPANGNAVGVARVSPDQRRPYFARTEFTLLIPDDAADSPFTLVRHPDTARLDWLEKQSRITPAEWSWRGGKNLRAALDAEMTNHPEIPESCAGGGLDPPAPQPAN